MWRNSNLRENLCLKSQVSSRVRVKKRVLTAERHVESGKSLARKERIILCASLVDEDMLIDISSPPHNFLSE